MKTNLSVDIAVIISLFTAYFYACGQNYLAAYLAVFYIDPVILNFPTSEKINWGFLNCVNFISIFLLGVLFLSFILYIFALLNIRYLNNLNNPFKSKKQHYPQIHNQHTTDERRATRIRLFFWPFFICVLIFSAFLSFAAIDIKTTKFAKEVLSNPTLLPTIQIKDENKLFLVKCGSSLCAVIDENKNISLVEPKNIIVLGSNFKKIKAP